MNRSANHRRGSRIGLAIGCAHLAAWCLGGCAPHARQFAPTIDPQTLTDTQYIHYLETVPVATFEEGCRALLLAADGEDPYPDHADRYAELRRRGVVRDAWKLSPADVLDYGTLCYMLAQVGHLPASVDSTLLGSWGLGDRRYAARRVAAEGLLRAAPTYKAVTGGELVWAVGRLDEWMQDKDMYVVDAPATP